MIWRKEENFAAEARSRARQSEQLRLSQRDETVGAAVLTGAALTLGLAMVAAVVGAAVLL